MDDVFMTQRIARRWILIRSIVTVLPSVVVAGHQHAVAALEDIEASWLAYFDLLKTSFALGAKTGVWPSANFDACRHGRPPSNDPTIRFESKTPGCCFFLESGQSRL